MEYPILKTIFYNKVYNIYAIITFVKKTQIKF